MKELKFYNDTEKCFKVTFEVFHPVVYFFHLYFFKKYSVISINSYLKGPSFCHELSRLKIIEILLEGPGLVPDICMNYRDSTIPTMNLERYFKAI